VNLQGKNVLVTGTSRGIGRAIARAFAAAGARVLCHARTEAAASELARELAGMPISGDLESSDGVASVAAQVERIAPELHVLVHNAAINPRPHERFEDVELAVFRAVMRVNVEAPIFLTQALLPVLCAAGGARVVFVSSEAGQLSGGMSPDSLSYRVSKTALNGASAVIAASLRKDRILVNAMHPGWVKTDMGGPEAPLSPDESVDTALYLATLPDDGPSGRFFFERRELAW
jgi:NAD(P)-dependent dehydrogenase (short-subunit alcohol dehydrogenase family)